MKVLATGRGNNKSKSRGKVVGVASVVVVVGAGRIDVPAVVGVGRVSRPGVEPK